MKLRQIKRNKQVAQYIESKAQALFEVYVAKHTEIMKEMLKEGINLIEICRPVLRDEDITNWTKTFASSPTDLGAMKLDIYAEDSADFVGPVQDYFHHRKEFLKAFEGDALPALPIDVWLKPFLPGGSASGSVLDIGNV